MNSFTTTLTVDATAQQAYAAITNVQDWWSGEVKGDTHTLGAAFTYEYPDLHWCRMEITQLEPGRRVEWSVLGSDLTYLRKRDEWTGTRIEFDIAERGGQTEVRFTHRGLEPDEECYDQCSSAWSLLVGGNLRKLIETGEPQPDVLV
jgi:activator of Hsp90 ATPase-like protein